MNREMTTAGLQDLVSVRDWLRFAVSEFNRAGLSYGQGTANAVDEAAFLILSTLHLPIDDLSPWLDCRLTMSEREAVAGIVRARVETRKPAAYLTNSAWIQGHKFYVDERTIVPRSYIGELLCRDGLASVVPDAAAVTSVLDLCTGSGCLAILAALAFPEARVVAADISADALQVAARNVADYGLEDRVSLVQSDLFAGLKGQQFDLVICNPPYVPAAKVEAFPPEHRAEPVLAHLGGANGMDLVLRLLDEARAHLSEDGALVVEVGEAPDLLHELRTDLPFLWLDTEESEGEVFSLSAADLVSMKRTRAKG